MDNTFDIYIDDGCSRRNKSESRVPSWTIFPILEDEESDAEFGQRIDLSSLIIYFKTVALYMDNTFDIC